MYPALVLPTHSAMSKDLKFPTPPADGLDAQLAALKKRAIPLHGDGAMFDAHTGCFFLEAKHPLVLEATVVKVPGSVVIGMCAGLFSVAVGPMLANAEQQLAKAQRSE